MSSKISADVALSPGVTSSSVHPHPLHDSASKSKGTAIQSTVKSEYALLASDDWTITNPPDASMRMNAHIQSEPWSSAGPNRHAAPYRVNSGLQGGSKLPAPLPSSQQHVEWTLPPKLTKLLMETHARLKHLCRSKADQLAAYASKMRQTWAEGTPKNPALAQQADISAADNVTTGSGVAHMMKTTLEITSALEATPFPWMPSQQVEQLNRHTQRLRLALLHHLHPLTRPSYTQDELRKFCFDFAAFVLELEWPGPSPEAGGPELEHTKALLCAALEQCTDLADTMGAGLENAQTGTSRDGMKFLGETPPMRLDDGSFLALSPHPRSAGSDPDFPVLNGSLHQAGKSADAEPASLANSSEAQPEEPTESSLDSVNEGADPGLDSAPDSEQVPQDSLDQSPTAPTVLSEKQLDVMGDNDRVQEDRGGFRVDAVWNPITPPQAITIASWPAALVPVGLNNLELASTALEDTSSLGANDAPPETQTAAELAADSTGEMDELDGLDDLDDLEDTEDTREKNQDSDAPEGAEASEEAGPEGESNSANEQENDARRARKRRRMGYPGSNP